MSDKTVSSRFPEPAPLNAFKWSGFFLFFLALLTLGSLLAIVHVQHEIRNLESRYYSSMQETLNAKEEWGRLMLEKKHLTSPVMVEKIAKEQLNMTLDKANFQYIYLDPTPETISRAALNLQPPETIEAGDAN